MDTVAKPPRDVVEIKSLAVQTSRLDARLLEEVSRRGGAVPSTRAMAAALGVSHAAVHRAYMRTGLRATTVRRARRDVPGRFHVSAATFDALCQQAAARDCTITTVASMALEVAFGRKRDNGVQNPSRTR